MGSKPEVFIIESLRLSDERRDRFEGQIIKDMLAFSGKECQYFYIRTKRELTRMLRLFTESEYRYLHLSCHGDEDTLATTLDSLTLAELGEMLKPHLKHRRLFISACRMTNANLARAIWPDSECFSLLGPVENIGFADAAILWASLYHVLFAHDPATINRSLLQAKAQEVSNMYRVRLRYFKRQYSLARGYSTVVLEPGPEVPA